MTARPAAPEIRTFLIADIRGYTAFSQRHGDEAAARLASSFAEIVREGVEAYGGEVIELRGDEALAVFSSARQALRAAVELQLVFVDEMRIRPALPLRVGMGLDAGEAVPVEGVITDNGSEFRAREFVDTLGQLSVQQRRIRAGRPQSNGHVERLSRRSWRSAGGPPLLAPSCPS